MKSISILLFIVMALTGCKTMSTVGSANPNTIRMEQEKVWVPAETRKIWVNSHVDEEGGMVDGHYKYVIVKEGHWAVKKNGR